MPQEKNHDWRGPGKTPVRNLAKVGVGGSNPLARSKFPVDFNPLPMDGPEEGFVHWRGTGAKPIEQKIDRTNGVLQIGRIECGIELGGAVVAQFVAELRCHFPRGHTFLTHPPRHGVTDRIWVDFFVKFGGLPHAAPGFIDLLDRAPLKDDEPA